MLTVGLTTSVLSNAFPTFVFFRSYCPKVDTNYIGHSVTDVVKTPSVFLYTYFIFFALRAAHITLAIFYPMHSNYNRLYIICVLEVILIALATTNILTDITIGYALTHQDSSEELLAWIDTDS